MLADLYFKKKNKALETYKCPIATYYKRIQHKHTPDIYREKQNKMDSEITHEARMTRSTS